MNKVYLIGRLTKDPELRKTNTDISVCRFILAVNRDYTPKGEEQKADFINCVVWRTQADNLCKYMRKGGLIAVDGCIQTGSYDDENGIKKFTTDVVANHIEFLESKKDSVPPETQQYYQHQEQHQEQQQEFNKAFDNVKSQYDISSDDIPF